MRDTPGFRPDESLIEESKSTVLEEPSTVMEVSRTERANGTQEEGANNGSANVDLPNDTKFRAYNNTT